jgi:hypothetical protein
LFLDTDQYIWDVAWTLQKCGSKVGEIWKLYKILKYIPFFFKKIKNILWLSLSMETRDFLQKKTF